MESGNKKPKPIPMRTLEKSSPNSTLMKKETVTTRQPDGTVVTKTTETHTVDSFDDSYYYNNGSNYEIEDSFSELNCVYCCTPLATLRLVQIVVGFIVIGCVTGVRGAGPFYGVLSGQTYVLIVACLCICITFAILIAYLFGFHVTFMKTCPWRTTDLIYSIIAAILYFIAGCLEAWYASGTWGQDAYSLGWSDCRRSTLDPSSWNCPIYIPWVIAAGFCFVNVLLYAIGACLAGLGKHYL